MKRMLGRRHIPVFSPVPPEEGPQGTPPICHADIVRDWCVRRRVRSIGSLLASTSSRVQLENEPTVVGMDDGYIENWQHVAQAEQPNAILRVSEPTSVEEYLPYVRYRILLQVRH